MKKIEKSNGKIQEKKVIIKRKKKKNTKRKTAYNNIL
jgi:hypothetical protein